MIEGNNLSYQLDGRTRSFCKDFVFSNGFFRLPYCEKELFSVLSLSFSPFISGFLSVDGVVIASSGISGGIINAIKVDISEIGSITIMVFYNGVSEEASKSLCNLVSQLSAIKSPSKNYGDQKKKLNTLKSVLSNNLISYILLDLNDTANNKNGALLESTLSEYKGTVFVLLKNPEKTGKVDAGSLAKSKRSNIFYIVSLFVTSFLAIFSSAFTSSTTVAMSEKSAFSILISISLTFANILFGIGLSKKAIGSKMNREFLFSFEYRSAALNILGLILATIAVLVLSKITSWFLGSGFCGFGLALSTVLGATLIISQPVIGHAVFESNISVNKTTKISAIFTKKKSTFQNFHKISRRNMKI
jgi:hypothetical protein